MCTHNASNLRLKSECREQPDNPEQISQAEYAGTNGNGRSRRKLWQIDTHFRCSIIGTCLTLDELRELSVKLNLAIDNDVTDYEIKTALTQADIVFCPLNYISHDAYYRTKKHCKQSCKKLVTLPQASLAAFISGLNELVAA